MESHCYAPMSGTRHSRLSLSFSSSLLLSLSLSAATPPIAKQRARRRERAKEQIDEEREDKRRDRDAYNYLSFYVREPGRLSQPVVLFLASAFTRLSSRHSFLFPFLPLLLSYSSSRARFPSFLFLSFFFSCPLLMAGVSDASAYERARDEREHERTDGRTDTRACIPESRNEVHASERES